MNAQGELLSSSASVPTARCDSCARQVLVYGQERGGWACVHCDAICGQPQWVGEEDLEALGYGVFEESGAAGCGTGCATGGCGTRGLVQTEPS